VGRFLWFILKQATFIYALLSIFFWILTYFYPDFDRAVGKLSASLALLVFVAVFVSISLWYLGEWAITGRWPVLRNLNDEITSIRQDIASLVTHVNTIITEVNSLRQKIESIDSRLAKLEGKNQGDMDKSKKKREAS
jgi:hypothetical protein